MTIVVSGTIIRDGRIFLTQRRAEKDFGLTWESAGGKCEPGETHGQALIRELNEEIDWRTQAMNAPTIANEPFFVAEFSGPVQREDRREIKLYMYLVTIPAHVWPVGREGQGSGWFDFDEFSFLSLAPGNHKARVVLQLLIRQSEDGVGLPNVEPALVACHYPCQRMRKPGTRLCEHCLAQEARVDAFINAKIKTNAKDRMEIK